MPVHDVQVKYVGPGGLERANFVGHAAQIESDK
jgi:hypothetical protein